jgi:hypothetical protein
VVVATTAAAVTVNKRIKTESVVVPPYPSPAPTPGIDEKKNKHFVESTTDRVRVVVATAVSDERDSVAKKGTVDEKKPLRMSARTRRRTGPSE